MSFGGNLLQSLAGRGFFVRLMAWPLERYAAENGIAIKYWDGRLCRCSTPFVIPQIEMRKTLRKNRASVTSPCSLILFASQTSKW
jgi:hypothetical protein